MQQILNRLIDQSTYGCCLGHTTNHTSWLLLLSRLCLLKGEVNNAFLLQITTCVCTEVETRPCGFEPTTTRCIDHVCFHHTHIDLHHAIIHHIIQFGVFLGVCEREAAEHLEANAKAPSPPGGEPPI